MPGEHVDTPNNSGPMHLHQGLQQDRLRELELRIHDLEEENTALRSRIGKPGDAPGHCLSFDGETSRHAAVVDGINRILNGILETASFEELGELCLSVAEEITGSCYGFINELEHPARLKHVAISAGGWQSCRITSEWGHNQRPVYSATRGIYRSIFATGKSFFTNTPQNHPDHIPLPPGHPPMNAFIGVPLRSNGHISGLIALVRTSGGYMEEDLAALESIAATVGQALERKRADETLRESEERFRIMADGIPQIIWVTDPSGRNIYANRFYLEFFGVTLEEIRSHGWRPLVHPEDEADYCAEFTASLGEQRPFKATARVMRHDGEWRWIESSARPRFSSDGKLLGFVGSSPDITDHIRTQKELRRLSTTLEQRIEERTADLVRTISALQSECLGREQAVRELREKDRLLIQQNRLAAMGEMINQIAHQWRQPLNVVGMHLQHLLLLYDYGSFDRNLLEDTVRSSMKQIQHMSDTIEDFRNFFIPDKERQRFCVNHAVQRAISLVKGGFGNDYIRIITRLECDHYIDGYPNEFSQALLNILQNARDALVEREVLNRQIRVEAVVDNGQVVVTISDNAGGIPEDILERIFEPYFSTKGLQGTGIGLFMTRNIIENNMGGHVSARNTPEGAEFRIEI